MSKNKVDDIKEMGLGKTLSTLALICWYLDARDEGKIERANDCSPTLVIVPKSSKFCYSTVDNIAVTVNATNYVSTYWVGDPDSEVSFSDPIVSSLSININQ